MQKNLKMRSFAGDRWTVATVHTVFQERFPPDPVCLDPGSQIIWVINGHRRERCPYTCVRAVDRAGSRLHDVDKLLITKSYQAAACTYSIICAREVPVHPLDGGGTYL